MNLNLSKSELNLLLSQLQQRLSELNTNGDDQSKQVDLSKRTTQKSFKNQPKSTSMFNLDLIDNSAINRRNSKSHVYSDQPRVVNGKSLSNLIQEESELFDQNEAFRHSASISHSSWNTQMDAISPNNSAHSANSQPRSYRRFVHNANPNFSVESFLSKKQQALEYRGQLDRQVEEKQRKLQQQLMYEKIKDAMLEQKINEQQKYLKKEFDADHNFDKNHSDNRAILDSDADHDKTETLSFEKTNSTNSHISKKNQKSTLAELKHPTLQTKSARPEINTVISTHTNNEKLTAAKQNSKTANANTSTLSYPDANHQNVCTQTDDSLLFDLIHDFMAKESMHRNMMASSVKRTAKTTAKPSGPLSQPQSTVRASLTRHSNSKPSVTRRK